MLFFSFFFICDDLKIINGKIPLHLRLSSRILFIFINHASYIAFFYIIIPKTNLPNLPERITSYQ